MIVYEESVADICFVVGVYVPLYCPRRFGDFQPCCHLWEGEWRGRNKDLPKLLSGLDTRRLLRVGQEKASKRDSMAHTYDAECFDA